MFAVRCLVLRPECQCQSVGCRPHGSTLSCPFFSGTKLRVFHINATADLLKGARDNIYSRAELSSAIELQTSFGGVGLLLQLHAEARLI